MVVSSACKGYHHSGFDWLGEIPEDWQTIRAKYVLREIDERSRTGNEELLSVSHLTGVTPRSEKNVNMFLAEDYTGAKLCQPNDVVVNTMWAWMGALGVSPTEGLVSPSYGVYRPNEKVFPKFLDSLLRTPQYIAEYIRRSTGIHSSRLRLYPNQFLDIPVLLPPLNEQKGIVEFIDRKTSEIDQAIAQKQRLIELLQEQKAILINQAVTKGLNPNVPMRDSGVEWVGEMPEHWNTKRLKFFLTVKGRIGFKGYTSSDLVAPGEGAITLGATHITEDGCINLNEPVFIRWEKYYESPEIMVRKNDLVIVQRGSTCGNIGFVDINEAHVTINPSLVLLKSIKYNSKYVFYALMAMRIYINYLISSTAIPMLSQEQIGNFEVPLPPIEEAQEIVEHIDTLNEEFGLAIEQQRRSINKLIEYKSILVATSVTGKIRV